MKQKCLMILEIFVNEGEERREGKVTFFLESVKNFSDGFGNHESSNPKVLGRKALPVAQRRIVIIEFLSNKKELKRRR